MEPTLIEDAGHWRRRAEEAREVAAQLGARTQALDGLGHFWMLEDPGRAADLLNRFWRGLER